MDSVSCYAHVVVTAYRVCLRTIRPGAMSPGTRSWTRPTWLVKDRAMELVDAAKGKTAKLNDSEYGSGASEALDPMGQEGDVAAMRESRRDMRHTGAID